MLPLGCHAILQMHLFRASANKTNTAVIPVKSNDSHSSNTIHAHKNDKNISVESIKLEP